MGWDLLGALLEITLVLIFVFAVIGHLICWISDWRVLGWGPRPDNDDDDSY